MSNSYRIGGGFFLGLVLAGAIGACQGQERRNVSGATGKSGEVASAASPGSAAEFISDSVLADHGFVSLWTKGATEGPFVNAFLTPEGIFAVARPKADSSQWRLIRYSRENGLPVWVYELEEPLRHPPAAYRYATPGTPRRSDELYILQKDVVHCIDLQYGAALWRVSLPFPVSCAPVVDETQYYVGSLDRRIYAMAKNKPFPTWTYITGGEIKSPGAIGAAGQIYFASTDKEVYRLEPNAGWMTGKSWRFATGSRILGSPVFFSRWVVVGSTDFKLYSFEVDGTPAWQFPVEAPIPGTPAVMSFRPDKPLAVCIAQDDRGGQEKKVAWAVDAKTGERQWQRDDTESVITVGKKAVYLLADPKVAGGRKIVSVDALKGEELTSLPVDGFDIIPLNDADHGTNAKARGIIFLISRSGAMQAIQEKP